MVENKKYQKLEKFYSKYKGKSLPIYAKITALNLFNKAYNDYLESEGELMELRDILKYGLEKKLISPRGPKLFSNGNINRFNSEQIKHLREMRELLEKSSESAKVDGKRWRDIRFDF
mgnify:FL=1